MKELAVELAAISVIADEAKKAKDRLREQLQILMDSNGADRLKAELNDEVIAYVTTSKPKFKWSVTSDKKFVEWVKANMPTEIVESVRESSVDGILSSFIYEDDRVIDKNGEVVDFLLGTESEPYLMTKFHADGKTKMRELLGMEANAIKAMKLLELEISETPSEQGF
jgi:hypothetical protein